MTEWIRVEDSLPELDETIYITFNEKDGIRMDLYFNSVPPRFEYENAMGWWVEPNNKPTHWMPLPEKPK